MAVKANVTTEGTAGPLYTGVASFKVVAINPGQEQLKAMGYKAEKAPVYATPATENQAAGFRIDVYLEATVGASTKIKTKEAFFLRNKLVADLFINKMGNFGKDRTKLEGELRNPVDGEIALLQFVQTWCNVKKGEEVSLDTIGAMASTGDVTELNQILSGPAKENSFKALCIVRDGKYQGIFGKHLIRSWSQDLSYLHKALQKEEKEGRLKFEMGPVDLKLFVPNQFDLKVYSRTAGVAEATAPAAGTAQSNGTGTQADLAAPDAPAATPGPNDPPF